VRDLEDGAPIAEDVRRLRDEIGELRATAAGLRERMELLEAKSQKRKDKKGKKKKR